MFLFNFLSLKGKLNSLPDSTYSIILIAIALVILLCISQFLKLNKSGKLIKGRFFIISIIALLIVFAVLYFARY